MHLHTNHAIPIIDSAESESSYGMTKSINFTPICFNAALFWLVNYLLDPIYAFMISLHGK